MTRRVGEAVLIGSSRCPLARVVVEELTPSTAAFRIRTADRGPSRVAVLGADAELVVAEIEDAAVTMRVFELRGDRVRLAFEGPSRIDIHREEVARPVQ